MSRYTSYICNSCEVVVRNGPQWDNENYFNLAMVSNPRLEEPTCPVCGEPMEMTIIWPGSKQETMKDVSAELEMK